MTTFVLKMIAIVTMILDHIGATSITYAGTPWLYVTIGGNRVNCLRLIGRLAFPIFAFLIAQGAVRTSNWKRYAMRLCVFGLISEIPFDLAFFGGVFVPGHQNVYVTLLLGMLAIQCDRLVKSYCSGRTDVASMTFGYGFGHSGGQVTVGGVLAAMAAGYAAQILHSDYGWCGVFMIFWFYAARESKAAMAVGIILINLYMSMTGSSFIQAYAGLAVIPILFYNQKKGLQNKAIQYIFYGFYPVHLVLLYILSLYR